MALPTNYIETSGLTYCGQDAQEIFAKDIYSLELRGFGVTLMDNVKGKRKIVLGDFDNAWQAYSCAFSPDGQVKLSEDYIEPSAIKVNKEVCYDEFWDTFLVEQTEISLNGGIPQTFYEWYFDHLRKEMAKEYEEMFWKGDTGYTGTTKAYLAITDGVEKKVAAGGTVVSGSTFTVDNILAQVEAAISKAMEVAASAETETDGYKVFMNKADVQLLHMALGKVCCPNSQSIFSNYAKGPEGGAIIFGYEVIPTNQSRNTVIVGPARNLVLGFDTFDSHLEYKIIDMRQTTGDNAFRVIALSNIGVGVAWPSLFVISKV